MTLTKIKILELFSGYGTSSFALKRLGIETEIVGYSDIDKYANHCFAQNHSGKQLGDVKLINPYELDDFDLLTGGFPCQAFSTAGKMKGETDARGTLFYEIIRIAEVKKPRYMLLENVKGLTCKKFKDTFDKILSELRRIGYFVHWKVLNTKDYGIPQSRARVWFVCFREYPEFCEFKFPEPEPLNIFIKDILEPKVDSKYYLSPLLQERFRKYLEDKEIKDNISVQMANMNRGKIPYDPDNREMGFQLNKEPVSYTIKQAQHEFLVYDTFQPIANALKIGGHTTKPHHYFEKKHDNFVCENLSSFRTRNLQGEVCSTLQSAMSHGNTIPLMFIDVYNKKAQNLCPALKDPIHNDRRVSDGKAIRKLTPKECFRLQGFLNDEINLEGLSDTQRYKLAGNGQSVNVVEKIFREMLK